MPDTLKKKLQLLVTRKYQISLAVLIPALLVLFVFGPTYIAIENIEKLLRKGVNHPTEYAQAVQQTLYLLRLVMWISITGALAAGLLLVYSILSPIRRVLADPGVLRSSNPAAEPDAEFAILGRDFSAMMSSLGQYVSILEGMSGGVIAFDREGRVTAMNPSAESIFGCRAKELIGRGLTEVCRDVVRSAKLDQVIQDGLRHDRQYASEEIPLRVAGGRDIVVGLTTSLLKDARGTTSGVVANITDLTGAKQMHEDLQKKLRAAGLGRLAAGVAHEVRNPLGAIKGMAQLIQEGLSEGDPRKKYGGVIEQEANRLNRVVENLLGLVHGPETPLSCNLGELIVQARQLASSGLGEKKVTVLDETETVPEIVAERERLVQAFLNIFLNAFEAVPDGGLVRVKTSYHTERQSVSVEIGNTGPKIDSVVKEHLFEPFFTTKERGTGLGLAIVHQIIIAQGGAVSVESTDVETVFRMELPVTSRKSRVSGV